MSLGNEVQALLEELECEKNFYNEALDLESKVTSCIDQYRPYLLEMVGDLSDLL